MQEIAPSPPTVLVITLNPVITWPAALANYQLQSRESLTATNWTAVTNVPALINGQHTVILDPAAAQKFYRLQRVQ